MLFKIETDPHISDLLKLTNKVLSFTVLKRRS